MSTPVVSRVHPQLSSMLTFILEVVWQNRTLRSNLSSMCTECVYTSALIRSSIIRLQSKHNRCILMLVVRGHNQALTPDDLSCFCWSILMSWTLAFLRRFNILLFAPVRRPLCEAPFSTAGRLSPPPTFCCSCSTSVNRK